MKTTLDRQGLGASIALAVQFALGMIINLYVEFPADTSPHTQWEFAIRNPFIVAHLVIGTLIVLGAVTMVVRAIRQNTTTWKLPAAFGLVSVLAAWIAGDTFVTTQADLLSYAMSLAFLLAILSYGWGIYRASHSSASK